MKELYRNIRYLRENMGLSQDTLAKLTGYSDRSSIAKIEKGLVDLQYSKIEIFAKILNTSPARLAGWSDHNIEKISKDSKFLLDEYKKMNKKGRKQLINTAQDMNCNPLYNNNFEIELKAAHERNDIEITDEMIKSDDRIMDDENF